jgi:hypothetical protein
MLPGPKLLVAAAMKGALSLIVSGSIYEATIGVADVRIPIDPVLTPQPVVKEFHGAKRIFGAQDSIENTLIAMTRMRARAIEHGGITAFRPPAQDSTVGLRQGTKKQRGAHVLGVVRWSKHAVNAVGLVIVLFCVPATHKSARVGTPSDLFVEWRAEQAVRIYSNYHIVPISQVGDGVGLQFPGTDKPAIGLEARTLLQTHPFPVLKKRGLRAAERTFVILYNIDVRLRVKLQHAAYRG